MHQIALYPEILAGLVERLDYLSRDGWTVGLSHMDRGQGSEGLTLIVHRVGPDTYNPGRILRVNHYFPVPPAAYNEKSWQRWIFDRLGDVDTHERMENFKLRRPGRQCGHVPMHAGDLCPDIWERPYAPNHGPGNDPYAVRELGSVEDQETDFRGVRHEGSKS
jgi:hypothetical protein